MTRFIEYEAVVTTSVVCIVTSYDIIPMLYCTYTGSSYSDLFCEPNTSVRGNRTLQAGCPYMVFTLRATRQLKHKSPSAWRSSWMQWFLCHRVTAVSLSFLCFYLCVLLSCDISCFPFSRPIYAGRHKLWLCVPVFCLFLADGLGCWDGEFLTDWQKVLEWYKKALVSDGLPLSIIYFLFLFASKHLELAWPNYDLWANTYADNTQCLCLK